MNSSFQQLLDKNAAKKIFVYCKYSPLLLIVVLDMLTWSNDLYVYTIDQFQNQIINSEEITKPETSFQIGYSNP